MFAFIFGTAALVVVSLLVKTAVSNERWDRLPRERFGH